MSSTTNRKGTTRKTRREILQLGGLAIAGTAVATAFPSKAAGDCCDSQSLPATSVFTTLCNDDSANKYNTGDTPATFRLAALWLLITTGDWSQNLRAGATEDQFKAGLVTELQLDKSVVDAFWQNFKDNAGAYKSFRTIWENQTADNSLYGKRPCIGGKSAVQIACLANTATPAKKKK